MLGAASLVAPQYPCRLAFTRRAPKITAGAELGNGNEQPEIKAVEVCNRLS